MPKFAVRRLFLSICAGALGAMGPRSGLAESLPSPTLPQLLAADVIAVGHFELVQGKIQFLLINSYQETEESADKLFTAGF